MKFQYFNPNPTVKLFKSGKPKIWTKDDSAIRALAKALNITWAEAYDKLTLLAKNLSDVPTSKTTMMEFCVLNGFEHKTYGKPARGSKRPVLNEFADMMSSGTYIVYLSHYFVCVKDGVFYNTEDLGNDTVYSYWKISE